MKPHIQFFKRDDGVRLAYSMFGEGPPMVVVSPWVSNLALSLEDPFILNFWNEISENCTIVLYDKHGCGQSDRDRKIFDVESELTDLKSVVRHLGLDKMILFGNSMAGPISINYAAQNTNNVSHLVLYGTYANGKRLAKDEVRNAIISLVKASWGMGSKALTDLFIPNATSENVSQWSRFQKESASPKVAAGLIELIYQLDVTHLLDQITIPTLVLHRREDSAINFLNGKELAYSIPNARLKALNGNIHFPFYEEPEVIIGEIFNFLSIDGTIAEAATSKSGESNKANELSENRKEHEVYKRQLAAILSADVKGYSRLMGDDEIHTLHTLKTYRQSMSNAIEHYNGRVVDNPGDNLLAEFVSAVDAVECALGIQKTLKEKNKDLPIEKRLEFRIGINIGDVIHDGDRIYGEGVNIAARIEGLADAGGICISRNTYDHIKNKLDLDTKYLGGHDVKNIKESVRVYKVLLDSDTKL